eukprot:gene3702-13771_t
MPVTQTPSFTLLSTYPADALTHTQLPTALSYHAKRSDAKPQLTTCVVLPTAQCIERKHPASNPASPSLPADPPAWRTCPLSSAPATNGANYVCALLTGIREPPAGISVHLSLIVGARHNGANYVCAVLTGNRDPPAGISVHLSLIVGARHNGANYAYALLPDLSLIVGARHNGANYVYALLTGYREPPAGISVREGLYYNPYFPGGAIAMPRMLVDGGVEYDDGTPGNASQQAKDLTTILAWSSYPYQDEMRVMGIKAILVLTLCFGFASYSKRLRWAPLKSQRIVLDVVN